jgi:rfaE bifunctional protein kinase chain/domain
VTAATVKHLLVDKAMQAISGRRVLLVGDYVLDTYVYGETGRVSREAPVLVVRKERSEHRLGGAANTAANLAALGVQTELVGAVGNDEGGARLRAMLHQAGADLTHVRSAPRSTAVKTRVLAGAFGTSKQQVLRLDDEPAGPLSGELAQQVVADITARAEHVDAIVISDYGMGAVPTVVVEAVCALARRGHRVLVDSRYGFRSFRAVTAITPNVPEAEAASGVAISDRTSAEEAARRLLQDLHCGACLLTQGRGGMTLVRPESEPQHVRIAGNDEVTDVTGAGDTVIATFSAALAAGLGMVNGMRLANCAAGIVVTKMGTATATPTEICAAASRFDVELQPWDE